MGFEEEFSKSNLDEGKESKGVETVEKMTHLGASTEETNGEMVDLSIEEDRRVQELAEAEPIGSPPISPKVNGDAIGEHQNSELSPKSIESFSNSNLEVNSAPTKGYGLKKWRRIRRDLNKDGGGSVDSSLILKRRFSLNEPPKSRDDNNLKNEVEGELETPTLSVGSIRSVEAVLEVVPMDPELVQLVASGGFSIGMDSDNSEDRSSKSSTAASVPKPRHEIGFGRERGRSIKNVGGRGVGNSLQQRSQRGRGSGMDTSKKIREVRVRLEKENSQSSVESDLRSSNVGVTWWGSGVSNGRHSEKSLNFDGEHGYESQKRQEVRSGNYKENGLVEDLSRENSEQDLLEEEVKVKRENFQQSSDIDPFVESIIKLQEAQEALETEIEKIGEIGKETVLDNFDDQFEEAEASSFSAFEPNIYEWGQKIEHLQSKLEEASATVKDKELKVLKLENIIKKTQLPKKETCNSHSPLLVDMHELETELDDILMKKIQSEVEFFIITRTTQSWKLFGEDQIALLEEQKSLAGNQAQVVIKLKDAEDKAIKLKEQTGELESHCKEISGTENIFKLQTKVCKSSLCFFVQLLLLCAAFGLFLIQLMPPSLEIVPT